MIIPRREKERERSATKVETKNLISLVYNRKREDAIEGGST